VTTRIRLLTWVLAAGYRNPLFTAHQISTLDHLSAGRLTLGLGTGYLRGEFRAAGADFNRRRTALDELLALLPAAWNGTTAGEGLGWTAPGNVVQPPPVQSPRPPIWIHGNSAWGTERAARADGWIGVITTEAMTRTIRTTAIPDHIALGAGINRVLDVRDRLGRSSDPFDIVVTAALPTFDIRRPWNIEQVRDQIGRLEELGATWLMINVIGDAPEASIATVQKFADDFIAAGSPAGV
jgi:probable F420-dependent oxidoreductase